MTIQKRDEPIEMKIAVACRNASGMPDMPVFTVAITRKGMRAWCSLRQGRGTGRDRRI